MVHALDYVPIMNAFQYVGVEMCIHINFRKSLWFLAEQGSGTTIQEL